MQRYILDRTLQSFITLFIVSLLVFGLVRMTGNPLDVMLDVTATPAEKERVAEMLGLNQPIYIQYGLFLGQLARGDLGRSLRSKEQVTDLLANSVPNTIELVALSSLIALAVAMPLAILAATHRGSALDVGVRVLALVGQSVPSFWIANVFILVFAVQLNLLPSGRKEGLEYYILPALTMALFGFMLSGSLRLLRGSMLEVLDSEFVKFARTKGVANSIVIWKHALRNALIPLITFVGFYFGLLIGGSVIIESVYAWPGVGRLAFEAVKWRDYPVIQGVVLYVSFMIMTINLFVDILYAYVDPRIRYG
jgi:peptide/nickel transport system permease protein